MSRILPILAILGIGLTACMSDPQSLAPNFPADEAKASTIIYDTIKISDDFQLIGLRKSSDIAARPWLEKDNKDILRNLKWPSRTVIRVSLHGPYPSNARGVLDTATRYWTSLISPNSPTGIAFKVVSDNDASAELKIRFPVGSSAQYYALAGNSFSRTPLPSAPDVITIAKSEITFYEKTNNTTNNWSSQDFLFNIALHELGHVLGLDDEYTAAYANEVMFYTPQLSGRRFFGPDDVYSINYLFNWIIRIEGNTTYIDQVRNPYQPFFNVFSNGSVDPTPIIGWQSAKELYSQGKSLRLMGILHDRFAGDANKVNISLMQATRGANLYSRFSYGGDLNSTLRSYNNGSDCPDMAIPNQMAMPTFALLPENTVHPILRARIVTALYTGTSKKIVWGSDAPSNCKDRLGAFYDLRTKI